MEKKEKNNMHQKLEREDSEIELNSCQYLKEMSSSLLVGQVYFRIE